MNKFVAATALIVKIDLEMVDLASVSDPRDMKQLRITTGSVTTIGDNPIVIAPSTTFRKPLRKIERKIGFKYSTDWKYLLKGTPITFDYSITKAGELSMPYRDAPETEWFESTGKAIHVLDLIDVSREDTKELAKVCDEFILGIDEAMDNSIDPISSFKGITIDPTFDSTEDAPKAPRGK